MSNQAAIESVEIDITRNGEVYPVEVDVFSCKFDMDGIAELEMSAFGYCKEECFQLTPQEAAEAEEKAAEDVPQKLAQRKYESDDQFRIDEAREAK